MSKPIFLSLLGLLLAAPAAAQSRWAWRVADYKFDSSQQSVGQQPAYFPANVLGPVSAPVAPDNPASKPDQVCSIGKGGHITLEFKPVIVNGPGMDFTVFENAFTYPGGVFDEWMTVAVSADGQTFHDFPYDTLTGAGMAGRTPAAATGADYFDPAASGGDSYDLAALGLDSVRYVRVTDATRWQSPDRLAADLDAVAAIHQSGGFTGRDGALAAAGIRASRNGGALSVWSQVPVEQIEVFALTGERLCSAAQLPPGRWTAPELPDAAVVLRISAGGGVFAVLR